MSNDIDDYEKFDLLSIFDLLVMLMKKQMNNMRSLLCYHNSPSLSLAGTSITRGLSIMRAVLLPFSTIPIIQD